MVYIYDEIFYIMHVWSRRNYVC